jgi:hypothetical protein
MVVHISEVVIIFVANYYRSMKYYVPMEVKGRIHGAAILEIGCICAVVVVSLVGVVVELTKTVRSCRRNMRIK